ncbi:hypothetical protein DFH28DRAFT_934801 [Melampsora americana]|nr:hypothetical protein DFH28DRAFT_934801 [Melampsora americana]
MQISKIIISLFATFVVVSCGPTCIPSESNNYCIGGLPIAVNRPEVAISNECSPCLDRIISSRTQRLDQEGHNSVGSVLASDSTSVYQLFSLHLIWISFLEKCSGLMLLVLLSQKKTHLAKLVRKSLSMFRQNIRLELIDSEYQNEKGSDDHLIKIFEKNVNK